MSYGDLLAVAIDAARQAGELLRGEFLRPDGPRGQGEHADADQPAELLIRARLLEATPDFSYRGEETAPLTGSDSRYFWLVDPNDGTAAYLKGYRGTATSIALLHDGVPVLGVVSAYAAPDNAGDLFAWAEGGPLTRNGVAVERGPWPDRISHETVAIVSQSADGKAEKNLSLIFPGRYRAEPSIAYRLALVAAGEGDLAIGLSNPGDWDLCGGHALLRGTGGALMDERARPVRYSSAGEATTVHSFGGAPSLLPSLSQQPWYEVLFGGGQSALCRPEPGETLADNGLLRRVQGCWLGQLCGDALGSMVEFRDAASIHRQHPDGLHAIGPSPVWKTLSGQPTDDSELALMLARTLLLDRSYTPHRVARAYVHWLDSAPFDIGGTIGQAVGAMQDAVRQGASPLQAARSHANSHSQSNGALMRQSPLAIWGASLEPEELDRIVRQDTRLTHPNRVCQDASAAYVIALAAAVRDGLSPEDTYAVALSWDREHSGSPQVTDALRNARDALPADFSHHAGHVIIALQNAFYQLLHAPSLEAGVSDTVMRGGDTDTNGAIAGALLGGVHGASAIPDQWRTAILTCRPQRGLPYVRRPRPQELWPVDALILSERLALAH